MSDQTNFQVKSDVAKPTQDERRVTFKNAWDTKERQMDIRHQNEYETVHNGSGRSEEMPSQLDYRHARERSSFDNTRKQADAGFERSNQPRPSISMSSTENSRRQQEQGNRTLGQSR